MSVFTLMNGGILGLVALAGTAVVFTREPEKQIIGLSFFGLVLALMFLIYQAPWRSRNW